MHHIRSAHSHAYTPYIQLSHMELYILVSWDVILHLEIVIFFFIFYCFISTIHPIRHLDVFNILCCYFCKFEFWFVKIIERENILFHFVFYCKMCSVQCSAHINHLYYWAMYSQLSIYLCDWCANGGIE